MSNNLRSIFTTLLLLSSTNIFAGGGTPAPVETGYTETENPVVLVHGIIGWDSVLNVYDYWYGIENHLEDDGATVYVANVPAMNNDTERGEALIAYLDELKAQHGHSKFNLLAHSQGGLTSRYAAAHRPDLVASVSSVSGAHQGSKLADVVSGVSDIPVAAPLIAGFVNALSYAIDLSSGNAGAQEDTLSALAQLDTAGATQFNQQYPMGQPTQACGSASSAQAANGVYYYSMGGVAGITNSNLADVFDYLADAGFAIYAITGDQSDGIIHRCSTRWGEVVKDNYTLNHADWINQTLGMRGFFTADPKAVLRTHVNRLKGQNL